MPTAPTMNARVTMTATVLGSLQLHRALQGRIHATSDFTDPFNRIADNFFEAEEQVFAREGAYDGAPAWKPLSPKYEEWKRRHYPGARIMHLTGRFEDAMTGGAGSIREVEPLRLRMGGHVRVGNYDLGGIHQNPRATNPLPQRKSINLGRRQRSTWVRIILDHLRLEGRLQEN